MPRALSMVWTLFVALLTLTAPALGQQLAPRVAASDPAPARFAWAVPPADSSSRRDFCWLGTAIGALGLGLAAGLEARAYCGNSENGPRDCTGLTIDVGLLGTAVGGALGHLIGRAIPRH